MTNTIKLEEIISYQEKTLNFLKLELEKSVELEKKVNSGLATDEEELEWSDKQDKKLEEGLEYEDEPEIGGHIEDPLEYQVELKRERREKRDG